MKNTKALLFTLLALVLSSCGKAGAQVNCEEEQGLISLSDIDVGPDTTKYDENNKVDLRNPTFKGGDPEEDEEDEFETFDVDKVELKYYNEDGNCNKDGTAGRAFYVWVPGIDGEEYSNEVHSSYEDPTTHETVQRVKYDSDGTAMTITIDMKNDPAFKSFEGCTSIMYIIKYKMESASNLNWGGQSEDVELKFADFPPDSQKIVRVYSTPAAGGGIAQFDSDEKTKVEGVKLANFTDWRTLTCTLSANATEVDWELYAFDETYFRIKPKYRTEKVKERYLVKTGKTTSKVFSINFTYNIHINAVYCIESSDINGIKGLKKIVYASFEKLYGTARFEKYYCPTDITDLGATYSPTETTFKVWSPVAANVSLYLYNSDTSKAFDGNDKYKGWHMNYTSGGIWTLTVKGDLANDEYKYYNYFVDTWSTSGVCMDPYAKACGACGVRGMIYDPSVTNPTGWNNLDDELPELDTPQKLSIYEVHVADFTGDESWNGPEEERGTFNGFVRSGTRLAEDSSIKTGFDHLVDLGVGAVQLVPVFDSDNDEVKNKKYNWGYNPLNYNCVEGVYSSDPHDGLARIREFKNMVNELAKNDIRTIMDVVYNHVSSPSASCFNKLMPRYYFRYDENGELYDGSGCHNEFKSEATMARKFIVDSVCWWAKEYNIKGFRFDLMALIDVETMRAVKKAVYEVDPTIYLYGEGWTSGGFNGGMTWVNGVQQQSYGAFAVPGYGGNTSGYQVYTDLYNADDHDKESVYLGAFDGSGRDAIRGANSIYGAPTAHPGYGFINQGRDYLNSYYREQLQRVIWGQRGDGQGGNPKQVVAYASCHDNWTLRDHLYHTLGDGGDNAPNIWDVLHASLAAQTFVFASNSAAFMYGGEELLRSKEIIPTGANANVTEEEFEKIPRSSYEYLYNGHIVSHNSYNSPLNVNSFKWTNKLSLTVDGVTINMKEEDVTGQYKNLIALHKAMPKYDMDKLNYITKGNTSTNGYTIGDVVWAATRWDQDSSSDKWDDNAGMGIQFDDWFVFVAARNFVWFRHWEVPGWSQRYHAGVVGYDNGEGHKTLNLGDEGTGIGLASAVYYRG